MAETLYRKIGHEIASRIADGRYELGDFLPTEAELCAEFEVSHHTVRDALKLLIERGLVVRRAGSGSRVIARHEPMVFAYVESDLRQVFSYPEDAVRENLSQLYVSADAGLAALLRCPEKTPWFRIGAIRRHAETMAPICWTDFYLLPRHADVVNLKEHLTEPVYEQIERLHGQKVQSAEVDLSITRLTAEVAGHLAQPAGSPAMMIVRRYRDDTGEPFETTVTYHPEGDYHCRMGFQRERRIR